jgi:hypothetical protein
MRKFSCSCHLVLLLGLVVPLDLVSSARGQAAEYLVSDRATNQILRYAVSDGTFLGALVNDDLASNGGLFLPAAMAYAYGGDLFVTSIDLGTGDGRVLRYDAESGQFEGVFASGLLSPSGLLYHAASNTILVGSLGTGLGDTNVIARFAADGTRMADITGGPISGRTAMLNGPSGEVYVSSFADGPFFSGSVLKYAYDPGSDTLAVPETYAAAAELYGANGLVFDPSGDLFVASLFGQSVVKFDVEAGAVVGSSLFANAAYPSGLLLAPDGDLLVSSLGNNNPNDPIYTDLFPGAIFKFNPTSGAMVGMGPFITGGAEFQPTAIVLREPAPPAPVLQAGDADRDLDFDQLDLVKVQTAAKYLTGQAATWGEGDWDGAPGGSPGDPPPGDGFFGQLDIVKALAAGKYLNGPYAAIRKGGARADGQTSVIYDANSGQVAVDAPAAASLTSINIDSAAGIFTGDPAANLGGSFDNDADKNIFKATFGSSFGSISFGNVAQGGLSEDFVANDLTVVGSLAGGGALGDVDLIYVPVPEPCTRLLLGFGLIWLVRKICNTNPNREF